MMKQEQNGSDLTLNFGEDLLSTSVKGQMEWAQQQLDGASGHEKVILDLTGTQNVDSQGLNLVVGLYQEARSRDLDFQVTNASESLRKLFDMVRLSERFGIDAN